MMPDKKNSDLQDREEELPIEFRLNEETSAGAKIIRIKEVSVPFVDEEEVPAIILPFSQIPRNTPSIDKTEAKRACEAESERLVTMAVAKERFVKEGFKVKEPSRHQLKVGRVNFWPVTGTVTVDGERTPQRGRSIDYVIRLLRKLGY